MTTINPTRFSILKSVCSAYNESHDISLKIKLNQSADSLLVCLIDRWDTKALDIALTRLFNAELLTDSEVKEYRSILAGHCPKFMTVTQPKSDPKFGQAYRQNRLDYHSAQGNIAVGNQTGDIVKVEKNKSKVKTSIIALSPSLESQFSNVGYMLGNTGQLIKGEYACKVLSELWQDESIEWDTCYLTAGYLEPITINTKPQSERIYLTEYINKWSDIEKELAIKLRPHAVNYNGGYKIPAVLPADQLDDKDLSHETALFTLQDTEYYQRWVDKTTYQTHPTELKRAGKIERQGFKTNVKDPLLRPLLGNNGLIINNIESIEFARFELKRLGSAAKYAARRSTPRKQSVKTKISWGTRFIPVIENQQVALSGSISLPNRGNSKDKIVLMPDGKVILTANGVKESILGHFDPRDLSSCQWSKTLPKAWLVYTPSLGGNILDRALQVLLESKSKRINTIKSVISADNIVNSAKVGNMAYTGGYSERQYKRLKQRSRAWAMNLDNKSLVKFPPGLRTAITKLKAIDVSPVDKSQANRQLIYWYQRKQDYLKG